MTDNKITDFIKKHHVLTLATSQNNEPYCANCFYAYLKKENLFVFSSDFETKHVKDVMINRKVAASIVLETKIPGKIRGLQITGEMYQPDEILKTQVQKKYFKRFPYAKIMKPNFWILKPNFFKLTDNRLGFGKKIIWKSE